MCQWHIVVAAGCLNQLLGCDMICAVAELQCRCSRTATGVWQCDSAWDMFRGAELREGI